jgi:hypothetical protein
MELPSRWGLVQVRGRDGQDVVAEIVRPMVDQFGVHHTMIQVESDEFEDGPIKEVMHP